MNISRVVTQLRSRSTASEVWPNERSESVHRAVAERFFRHLVLVGDYHTHPYRDYTSLRRNSGWEYSAADAAHIPGWVAEVRKTGAEPRFSLIAAVAEGGRAGQSGREKLNRIRYCVDGRFILIAAHRILPSGDYDDREEGVTLRAPGVEDPAD